MRKARPRAIATPSMEKKFPLTMSPWTAAGVCPTRTSTLLKASGTYAATSLKTFLSRRSCSKTGMVNVHALVPDSQTWLGELCSVI
jgi:hypothetical protein